VTCLCLTRNRRTWLPKAIACFQKQTYPQAELLILADGQDVRELLPDDDRVRLIHLSEVRTIGEKRNFGCGRAQGDVICHWDDDDWSAPGRLADQIPRLNGIAVTGYNAMRFTDGGRWWRYQGTSDYALGTSLCYLRSWWQAHPFKACNVGEDNVFVNMARSERAILSVDAGELMHATIHPNNTSPRHITANWIPL